MSIILISVALMAIVILLTVEVLFPLGYMGWVSLTDKRAFSDDYSFVGLHNYISVLGDESFRRSAINTLIYALGSGGGQVFVGAGLAMLISAWPRRKQAILAAILIMPYAVVPVVVSVYIWRFLCDMHVGLITRLTGIALFSPEWVTVGLIVVSVWIFSPFVMILVLYRLRQIPSSYYETIAGEGAGSWTLFRYVTLPQVLPTLRATLGLRLILMATKFDLPYLLLGSGPASLRHGTVAVFLYETAYEQMRYGLACASALLLVAGLLIPVILVKWKRSGVSV